MEKNVKNYYEILEVDKKASPEIIEKSYKVLAKKYHPDLQKEGNIKKAEAIMNTSFSMLCICGVALMVIGMLMIPKTCEYVWTVLIGYRAMKKEIA